MVVDITSQFSMRAENDAIVLVVDDEADIAMELSEFLSAEGCPSLYCDDPLRAAQILRESPAITVLLTDLRMAGIDGAELARLVVRQRSPANPLAVVTMTGHAERESAFQDSHGRFSDFFVKPVDPLALLEAVRRLHAAVMTARLDGDVAGSARVD